jgi:aspartate dehydrogenase
MTSEVEGGAKPPIRVALAGLGAVGKKVAEVLRAGDLPGFTLAAVAARDRQKAEAIVGPDVAFVTVDELEPLADVVVECAPAALLPRIVRPFVAAGKKAVVLSIGALLTNMDLIETAKQAGGQIIAPSGALLGLDAVSAAAEGTIRSVKMITRKPVRGLVGAPYLVANGIDIDGITEPMRVFAGTAREAAAGFPANLNVSVALSLAGVGPDETTLEIWADPNLERNTHRIEVDADSASFSMSIENVPSENPKTGLITALSVIAALRKMNAPLRVGC